MLETETNFYISNLCYFVGFFVVVICSCPLSLALTHDELFHHCYSHPAGKLGAILLFNCLLKSRSSNLELTLDCGHTPVHH